MLERLRRASRFLGYGDPKTAKVCFVGPEQRYIFKEPEELDDENIIPDKVIATGKWHKHYKTPTYRVASKVVLGLQGGFTPKSSREYLESRLFQPGSEAILMSLYPLGYADPSDWPNQYRQWFGLATSGAFRQWIREKTARWQTIGLQRKRSGNPLTICFGLSAKKDFIECFGLQGAARHGQPTGGGSTPRILSEPATDFSVGEDEAFEVGQRHGITWAALQKHALGCSKARETPGGMLFSRTYIDDLARNWIGKKQATDLLGLSRSGYHAWVLAQRIETLVVGKTSLVRTSVIMDAHRRRSIANKTQRKAG